MLSFCSCESAFLSPESCSLGSFLEARANDPVRQTIREINNTISKLDDGDKVHYLDIGAQFLNPDGNIPADVMSDAPASDAPKATRSGQKLSQATLNKLMDREPQKVIADGQVTS